MISLIITLMLSGALSQEPMSTIPTETPTKYLVTKPPSFKLPKFVIVPKHETISTSIIIINGFLFGFVFISAGIFLIYVIL